VHKRGQPELFRAIGQSGRPQPGGVQPRQAAAAVQRGDQRVRDVPAAGTGAAADQGRAGEPGCGQQRRVLAGKDRHRARPGAARGSGWDEPSVDKELAALDEHQVRGWTSRHRRTILALLACAFLSILAASQAGHSHPQDDQMTRADRNDNPKAGHDGDDDIRPSPEPATTENEPDIRMI
jgi:hypothetical protein